MRSGTTRSGRRGLQRPDPPLLPTAGGATPGPRPAGGPGPAPVRELPGGAAVPRGSPGRTGSTGCGAASRRRSATWPGSPSPRRSASGRAGALRLSARRPGTMRDGSRRHRHRLHPGDRGQGPRTRRSAWSTPDVEYDNVPMAKVCGPEAVRTMLTPFLAGCSAVDWVVHQQVEQVDGPGTGTVMNERTDRFEGEGGPPAGSSSRWPGSSPCGVGGSRSGATTSTTRRSGPSSPAGDRPGRQVRGRCYTPCVGCGACRWPPRVPLPSPPPASPCSTWRPAVCARIAIGCCRSGSCGSSATAP